MFGVDVADVWNRNRLSYITVGLSLSVDISKQLDRFRNHFMSGMGHHISARKKTLCTAVTSVMQN